METLYWWKIFILRRAHGNVSIQMCRSDNCECYPHTPKTPKEHVAIITVSITLTSALSSQSSFCNSFEAWWRHQMETFPRYWPFVFTVHRWIPRTKASDAELCCFLWSVPWICGWANNREAGDLRRQRAHYDVIVMGSGTCRGYPILKCGAMTWINDTLPA